MPDAVSKDISRDIKHKSPEPFIKQVPTLAKIALILGIGGTLLFLEQIGPPIKPEKDLISKTSKEPTPTKPSPPESQKFTVKTGDTLSGFIEKFTRLSPEDEKNHYGVIWWRLEQENPENPYAVFTNRLGFILSSELLNLDYLQPGDQVEVGTPTEITETSRNLSPNLSIRGERTATQDNETLLQLFVKTNGQDALYDQDLTLFKVGDNPWMVEITKDLQADWTIVQQRMSLNNQTFHQVAQELITEQGQ